MQYGWYLLDDIKRRLIKSNSIRDIVPYGPFHVEFQPMGLDGAPMEYRRFTELLDELNAMNLLSVRLGGKAEPLAHPRAVEMIRYLASSGVAIAEVETDGILLNEEMIGALLDAETHTVVARLPDAISTDGDSFELAIESLRRLRHQRSKRNLHLPKLTCRFSVHPGNFGRLERMIKLAREVDADLVSLDLAEDQAELPAGRTLDASEIALLQTQMAFVYGEAESGFVSGSLLVRGALDRYAEPGDPAQGFTLPPYVQRRSGNGHSPGRSRWIGDRHCYIPWYHMLIDAHFEVWPCRFLTGEDFRSLGNVRDEAAAAVWNGPRTREYRSEFSAAMLNRPIAGLYLCDRCVSCNLRETLTDNRFYDETEAWLERQRVGMSAPTFPGDSSTDGFAHPALRAMRERFPRSKCAPGSLELVTRIHAEAEIARIEALRLRVRAAALQAQATQLQRRSVEAAHSEKARVDGATIKRIIGRLDSYADQLFDDARRVSSDLVDAAPPPFQSMCDWLQRLHEIDPLVGVEVDHTYVIWMSLFKTLADSVDMSEIQRVMGVGVGSDGPEVNYNDHFPEHYCLDLVDYSERNPKLKFVTANIEERVPFPDESFDLVYSHSVFEHLKNMPRAIVEIDRLLGVGKYVYITVSPLYYSAEGSHVTIPERLSHWEHLYPGTEQYLLDSPDPKRIQEGVFLNKMTIANFLEAVGSVGWEILHFSIRIVHPHQVPSELKKIYPLVDLVAQEYRFVGRKVIPKVEGIEW